MKERMRKKHRISALIIALLIVISASVSIVSAIAKGASAPVQSVQESVPYSSDSSDERMLHTQMYSATHNRSRWLYDLLTTSGKAALTDSSSPRAIFKAARGCGVISSYSDDDMYQPLNRIFVAQTTVKALGYKKRSAGRITDITSAQSDMSTMAYYGYFLPDVNYMVHPEAEITASEYDSLLSEIARYRLLRGKKVLSFGDSIMYGSGNNGEGIADMLAEKYGMVATDYSVPGAAMGLRSGRGHIIDQLTRALNDKVKPDMILINGGTNDMNHTEFGSFTPGFDMSKTDSENFTGGFEKTMWKLRKNWSGVPVVYIRVHNMDLAFDDIERKYGERAISIAKKWNATAVDLYENTDMNTENAYTCARYTCMYDGEVSFDSIHPTAVGYAKFYLPLISGAVTELFQRG